MFFESGILGERKRPSSDGRFLLYRGYEKDVFAFFNKDLNSNESLYLKSKTDEIDQCLFLIALMIRQTNPKKICTPIIPNGTNSIYAPIVFVMEGGCKNKKNPIKEHTNKNTAKTVTPFFAFSFNLSSN